MRMSSGFTAMKSRRRLAIFVVGVALLLCGIFLWRGGSSGPLAGKQERSRLFGERGAGEAGSDDRRDRKRDRDRAKVKVRKGLSTAELDRYLEARGVNEATLLFALLNSGEMKYRDLAAGLPDSPLKFMMLSMDVHDDPKTRLEWSKKLYELDPLNRVSAARYVSQLMDAGEKEKAAEVLATVKNCNHASNGYDRLIGEIEFARGFFGDERFGPRAVVVVRTWAVRTSYYTIGNYLDSLEFPESGGKPDAAFIHDKAKTYLLDVGHSESSAEMDALIQSRMLIAGLRSETRDPVLKDEYSKDIAAIQARTDALFHEGLDHYEKVEKHRSAAGDMEAVMENMAAWKERQAGRK